MSRIVRRLQLRMEWILQVFEDRFHPYSLPCPL